MEKLNCELIKRNIYRLIIKNKNENITDIISDFCKDLINSNKIESFSINNKIKENSNGDIVYNPNKLLLQNGNIYTIDLSNIEEKIKSFKLEKIIKKYE